MLGGPSNYVPQVSTKLSDRSELHGQSCSGQSGYPLPHGAEQVCQGGAGPSQGEVHTGRLDGNCITMITAKDARIVAAISVPTIPLRC